MVLYIVGLGLGDEKDITVRGREIVESCDIIFLESYTSILSVDKDKLEAFYGKTICIADRNCVESEADDDIIKPALTKNVALLVVGDPVCATTHTDIMLRAKKEGIQVQLVHNASVMGAVGVCGLQLYNFGQTVSIPFYEENWRPTSFYPKIKYNLAGNMHTLCLLDIKVKEPDFDAMARGRTVFLPPRFMTAHTAAAQLLEAEEICGEEAYSATETLCVGLARLGQVDQTIVAATLGEMAASTTTGEENEKVPVLDLGGPLHSLVLCCGVSAMHDLELEMLEEFMTDEAKRRFLPKAQPS